jgi:hypothetical protein
MKSTYSPTAEPNWFHILSILTIAWPSVLISLQLSGKTLFKKHCLLGIFPQTNPVNGCCQHHVNDINREGNY